MSESRNPIYCMYGCGRELRGDNVGDLAFDFYRHAYVKHAYKPEMSLKEITDRIEKDLIAKIRDGECTNGPRGPKGR